MVSKMHKLGACISVDFDHVLARALFDLRLNHADNNFDLTTICFEYD